MNESQHPPRLLAGPFWSEVLARLAPRLEHAWGELVRTSLEWSATAGALAESGAPGPRWEGPLEPFDESLRVELSPRLCQGVLGRMLGATEQAPEPTDRGQAGQPWGRLELQLLERLAGRAAVEFCGVLHDVSGLPLTIPCLWPVSAEGPSSSRGTTAGLSGRGPGGTRLGSGGAGRDPGSVPGDRNPGGSLPAVAPAGVWCVQATGPGLAGVLCFGLPPGVLALLEETREGGATPAQATLAQATLAQETLAQATATVTAEVVLAEVELPADEVWNLEVGDMIPLGRAPGREGEPVFLDIPGVGRVPAVVISRDGVLEIHRLPPGDAPAG